MKSFIDTGDLKEIVDLASTGLLDGVTTNPSLIAKSGRSFLDLIADIRAVVPGPVSAEVTATDHDAMRAEGRRLAKIAPNIAVKVPPTVLRQLFKHPLTDKGLEAFLADWAKTGQSILGGDVQPLHKPA